MTGQPFDPSCVGELFPTYPGSASGGNAVTTAQRTQQMLAECNVRAQTLFAAVKHSDKGGALVPYGAAFTAANLVEIPPDDFPAGLPPWVRSAKPWAARTGAGTAEKRRTLTGTVLA